MIVAIDDTDVHTMDDLIVYLAEQMRPGQKVILTVLRDLQRQDIEVILGTRPRGQP